ncbi:hypothetical protein [uncultured Draconibacterium sp.]|uniref:hypothetical protein n=1 Tax=uncultured Draconibacterium sp. TaxID=1573823 RepID=UPI003260BCF9
MKNLILSFILFVFLVPATSLQLQAQETEGPSMFLIFEEFVAPDNMNEFWKVQTEALDKYDELDFNMTFSAYRTDDFSFYWSMPLKNFAALDELFADMMKNHQLLMENGYNPAEKFRGLSNLSHFVVSWNKELSYSPADYQKPEEPEIFHEWAFIYLKSGHEKQAAEILKKYRDFYDSIEENYHWDVYEVLLGNHTPCWIVESRAKNELEMRKLEADMEKKYGEKFMELWSEFVKHTDKMEIKKGWYMPKWSR